MSSSSSSDDDVYDPHRVKRRHSSFDGEDDGSSDGDRSSGKKRRRSDGDGDGERKRKKEKKHKEKKKKKHKKEKKRRRRDSHDDTHQSRIDALDKLDDSSREFALQVQGDRLRPSGQPDIKDLLQCTDMEQRAASMGLPKGLLRTATSAGTSFSDVHAKKLFGHSGEMNPAAQQRCARVLSATVARLALTLFLPRTCRMARERVAQRAERRAREILEARRAAGSTDSSEATVGSLTNRFSGGTIQGGLSGGLRRK